MSDIRVERKHGRTKQAAMEIALQIAERARDKAQVQVNVRGDVIELERSGGKGKFTVGDETVVADVTLSFMLKPMRSMIEGKIADYFERYFK